MTVLLSSFSRLAPHVASHLEGGRQTSAARMQGAGEPATTKLIHTCGVEFRIQTAVLSWIDHRERSMIVLLSSFSKLAASQTPWLANSPVPLEGRTGF
jgi:hypothetical protein